MLWLVTLHCCLQSWHSVWETQSRWFCVMQRRQKSSTCSLWITQRPACTGWRCMMTAGVSLFQWRRYSFFLYWLLGLICFIFFSSTLSSFSESEDESSRFLPKLPTLPKRWDSELHALWKALVCLNDKCLDHSFCFYIF